MKKRQRKVRLIRAAIQLISFIVAPSLFSTAFAGIKSIFLAIGGQQSVTWNSFLDITALLVIITILFGRHFCGYACAFGSLGDALYELTAFIRAKCFGKKKKHGYPEIWVHRLQKVQYLVLALLLLSCLTGMYSRLQGMSPWDVFSMLTTGRLPKSTYNCRHNITDPYYDRYVYTGKIFLSVSLPNGCCFCDSANLSGSTF